VNDTVNAYLDAIEGERGVAMRTVFETVRDAMPAGYELVDFRGAPSWVVPLSTYPVTYNKEPLSYAAIMAHKSTLSLYLMGLYADSDEERAFRDAWATTGLKLDMGKSCVRFKKLDDLDLGIIRDTVASVPPERLIEFYERSRRA
jgi:hypothetical protein